MATASSSSATVLIPDNPLVLVVDDDPLILATVSVELRRAGCRVREAGTAEEAIDLCAAEVPAVVIADFRLPNMSGVQLSASLNAEEFVPIIFLSAFTDPRIVQDAVTAGAYVYLSKPLDPRRLIPVVQAALHQSSFLRAAWLARNADGAAHTERLRSISVVTGLIMERFGLSYADAYNRLRNHARSNRLKIADVAHALLGSADQANQLMTSICAVSAKAITSPEDRNVPTG